MLAPVLPLRIARQAARKMPARQPTEFLRLNPKFSVEAFAKLYKDPAVAEQLINALRKAGLK